MTMATTARTIPARTVGRYLLEPATAPARGYLVGFHGYAENAEAHLAELSRIPGAEAWHRVAVLALHRFYNTKTQDVVASWMTRLDREQAIADNLAYVRSVVDAVRGELGPAGLLVFCGFSQGASMAWRAAARTPCDGLLALGGDIPPDVAESPDPLPAALLGRGLDDAWYSAGKLDQDLGVLASRGGFVESCVFEGGHVWTDAFREAAGRFLSRLPIRPSGGD
jgi:predicted esterase